MKYDFPDPHRLFTDVRFAGVNGYNNLPPDISNRLLFLPELISKYPDLILFIPRYLFAADFALQAFK